MITNAQAVDAYELQVYFRDGKAKGLKKLVKVNVHDILEHGSPVDKDGMPLRAMSAKINLGEEIAFAPLEMVIIGYKDGSAQNLAEFIANPPRDTVISGIEYYSNADTTLPTYEECEDDELFHEEF